jgi:hypothetical protein
MLPKKESFVVTAYAKSRNKTIMKIMNFSDGPREIKEGMTVAITNGQDGSHLRISEYKVLKVGRDLVTLNHGGRKFYLETGREQTNYTRGYIYSSLAAYQEMKKQNTYISNVKSILRNVDLSYMEAQAVAEVLNLDVK